MIVNVICAAVETLVQMLMCFGVFIKAYGGKRSFSKFNKFIIAVLIVIVYLFLTLNNVLYVFSISAILSVFPISTIVLWIIIGNNFFRIVSWCFFNTINVVILKLPVVAILGIIYDVSLSEMNLIDCSQTWSRAADCVIFIILFLVGFRHRNTVIEHFKNMYHQCAVLLFIGSLEYVITLYILYIGWYGFTIQTFILTVCLIFMLFMLVICLTIIIEYQIMVRINRLLKAKEDDMRMNYALINQEIDRNRKINHDKKYDLDYLYNCFEQRDYKRGLDYIKRKEEFYNLNQKNLVWTGHGSIDFLLNRAKARADEKKILFTIKVDIVEIPIEEYDFFSMLSNLLDNAIEASEQNHDGERRIAVQILSLDNVFKLSIENTYLIEPVKKGKNFVSGKDDTGFHGLGLENVKEIVRKYNGELDINYGNKIFLVNLIII